MNHRFRVKEFGQPISLQQTLSYLDSRGWKTRNDNGLVACEGPTDDFGSPIVAFIPDDERCPDYPLRLEDLIFVICQTEDRPAAEIAGEMATMAVTTDRLMPDEGCAPETSAHDAGPKLRMQSESFMNEFRESIINMSTPQLHALWILNVQSLTSDQRRALRDEAKRRYQQLQPTPAVDDEILLDDLSCE